MLKCLCPRNAIKKMSKLDPYMKARKFRKRSLAFLILLIDGIIVLILVHTNKGPRRDEVELDRLRWLGSKTQIFNALESLQNIRFSEIIARRELNSVDVGVDGHIVDVILNRINIMARLFISVYPARLKGVEKYVPPDLVDEEVSSYEFLKAMAILLIRKIENGEVEYPPNGVDARRYVVDIENIVMRYGDKTTDPQVALLVSRNFPNIKIGFCAYVALVLVNIREKVVGRFDLVRSMFCKMEMMEVRNSKITEYKSFYEEALYKYNRHARNYHRDERKCVSCHMSLFNRDSRLLMAFKKIVVCDTCSEVFFFTEEHLRSIWTAYSIMDSLLVRKLRNKITNLMK